MNKIENVGSQVKEKAKKLAALTGIVAVSAAGGVIAANAGQEQAKPSKAAVADQEITNKIALKQNVHRLKGGTAVVSVEEGHKEVIKDPIIARNGAVAERAQTGVDGQQDVVTTYAEGEGGVKDIEYYDKGKVVYYRDPGHSDAGKPLYSSGRAHELGTDGSSAPAEARAASTPVVVDIAPNSSYISGESHFVAAQGQPEAGEHIAEGTALYSPHEQQK